jgi:predicted AAA+ superfamily ATPase
MDELFANHAELAMDICQKIKPLEHFGHYLSYGYYPFYLENLKAFHQKLHETIQVVLEIDIPQFESMQISGIVLLKRLLQIIAASVPFKPNMNVLSQRSGISLNTMKLYLKYLNDSGIISLLYPSPTGINSLNKPEKIYLQNTNLMHSLAPHNAETGNLRETFFLSQMSGQLVSSSKRADFIINNKYIAEIGGKNKSQSQISDSENGFIIKDQINIGYDNIIPLWLFGFLF